MSWLWFFLAVCVSASVGFVGGCMWASGWKPQ